MPSLQELGAGWVRLNYNMDGSLPDFTRFLDAGVNVVITFINRDPQNVANPQDLITFSQGGFPYVNRTAYQNRIRDVLTPLLGYLPSGRQIDAQIENEIGPFNTYWHADLNAYLPQLSAGYEAVHALTRSIPVATYGIGSGVMELMVYDPGNATDQVRWLTTVFSTGQYDVVDMHFYHCPSSIPAKVQAVVSLLPAPKPWISTENGGPDTRCASTPNFTEEIEAEQVPVRLQACADNGGSVCLWFSFFDMVNTPPPFDTLGLLERPAVPGGEPRKKAAYWAFQAYIVGSDGDGVPDALDNCPTVPNAGQENNVHPLTFAGDACEDPDADLVMDAADNCPDAANSGQENTDAALAAAGATLAVGVPLVGDGLGDACDNERDNDSGAQTQDPGAAAVGCPAGPQAVWADCVEAYLGTDPLLNCGANAWPPDFNGDKAVNILDVSAMFPFWLGVHARHDLNADGAVNIVDVAKLFPFWLYTCT